MNCVADLRKSKNMTIYQMSALIGVSESLYSKIEYGVRKPSRGFMQKFKKAFPEFDMNIFFATKLHVSCSENKPA